MKHKLKKIISSAFILIAFIIFSCSEDYEIHEHNHNHSKIKVKPISINDVISNQKAFEKLTNPKSRFKTNSSFDRTINDSINNFSIETENGIFIEDEDYHSYTFKVTRPNGSNFLLENVVVSKKNETEYETILYQYNITQQELDMIDNGEFVNLNGKINKIFLENSVITSEVTGKYYFNGSCYEDNPVYIPGNTCPQGIHDLSYVLSHIGAWDQCTYYLNGTYTATSGTWTWQSSLVPCDDGGGGGNSSGSGEYGGGGSGGGSTTTTPVNNCRTCPPEFNPTPTPCQQLNKVKDSPIVNSTPSKKIKDNLIFLKNNVAQNKEMMYIIEPNDITESNFNEHYLESPLNSSELNVEFGNMAVSYIIHTHYDVTNQLSTFSLSDIFQIFTNINSGNINSPETFTAILITAHGTQYAIKITNKTAFLNWGNTFFYGWLMDFGNNDNPYITGRENDYKKYVDIGNTNILNEYGISKFFKDKNLGLELYSADSNFAIWSKITPIESTKSTTKNPCSL